MNLTSLLAATNTMFGTAASGRFPLLTVIKEDWTDAEVKLEVRQSWFLSDGSEISSEEKKLWRIPLLTCTEAGTQPDLTFMREETASVTVPLNSPTSWVKLNAGQNVPMRVCCTSNMTERIATGIKNKSLPVADRAGLLNDGYALVKAGHMSPESLIKLISQYSSEDDGIVWDAIESVLGGLDTVMSDDVEMSANFYKFAKKIVLGLTSIVSWDRSPEDGHLTSLLRGTMVRLLSIFCFDDDRISSEAARRFSKFQEDAADIQSLPSDMRLPVFQIVLKNGGLKEYDAIFAYFDSATDPAERKYVLGSLGSTRDPKLKMRTLEWAVSGAVKLQDL